MYPNSYAFPAFFYYDADGIAIEFPDLPGCLPCAMTTEEAFHNAREALGLHLFSMEQDGDAIPNPTPVNELRPETGAAIVMIEVFMPPVRDRLNNTLIKKTITIPTWLNSEAEAANVDFSLVLQNGLKKYLGIKSAP